MAKEATQTKNGKAFEYALLIAFFERLNLVTNVSIISTAPFLTAKKCFELFAEKEKGLYNKEVATKFKNAILSRGGTAHPMDLYKEFRGREPDPNSLLKRSGLL